MATYLPGSNVQADAMQTLYLMNPSYTGYSDSGNASNMILISSPASLAQCNSLSNPAQQQHYIGFPLPPALTENSFLQQPTAMSSVPTSNLRNQLPNDISNQTYNLWNGQSNIPLISADDMAHASHSIAACLTSVNSHQPLASDISQYNVNRESLSPLQDQQTTYSQNTLDFGLSMENRQVSVGHGQGLSLSLSSQQPSATQLEPFNLQVTAPHMTPCTPLSHVSEDNSNTDGSFLNNWTGNVCTFRTPSSDGILNMQYHNTLTGVESSRLAHLELGAPVLSAGLITKTRYLKATQQLLDEIVSFGRYTKNNTTNSTKAQTWMGFGSGLDGHYTKDKILSDTFHKRGITDVTSVSGRLNESIIELTSTQSKELQLKKAKLMGMHDEVNRRYKQYYSQLQIVVSSFESAAGLGAAKTYTALALKTISRHFRCLRDAISIQIRATSKALGEEDTMIQGKGGANLLFVDQQLQQRALQQLGMIQQHTWRPQRGLPEHSVSILRAWLFEHFLHPYPKDADKIMLARQTGLTRNQVSNWFINARVRLWKPMVEEMYLEETKAAEMEAAGSEKKAQGEVSGVRGGECQQHEIEVKSEEHEGMQGQPNSDVMVQTPAKGINMPGSTFDSHFHHGNLRKGLKAARTGIHESASRLSSDVSEDIEMKLQETSTGDRPELESTFSTHGHHKNNFGLSHDCLVHQVESVGGFGAYPNLGGTAVRYPGNGSVSLTLGLQHCDGLSLSHGQKSFLYSQGSQNQTADGRNEPDSYCNANNNNMHEAIGFQNRKRFATASYQRDFVA